MLHAPASSVIKARDECETSPHPRAEIQTGLQGVLYVLFYTVRSQRKDYLWVAFLNM